MTTSRISFKVADAVIQATHSPSLRIADSAQAELRLLCSSSLSNVTLPANLSRHRQQVVAIARTLSSRLHANILDTDVSRRGRRILRRSFVRRAVKFLGEDYFKFELAQPPAGVNGSIEVREGPMIGDPDCLERDCLLADQLVATVFLERDLATCTLVWPVAPNVTLPNILDYYLASLSRKSAERGAVALKMQGWCGDNHFELQTDDFAPNVFVQAVEEMSVRHSRSVDIMEIASDAGALEILFGEGDLHPSRIALVLSSASSIPIMSFFSKFHRSAGIRSRYRSDGNRDDAALMRRDALAMLSPLPISN